jgi:hypothetical protein
MCNVMTVLNVRKIGNENICNLTFFVYLRLIKKQHTIFEGKTP